MATAPGITLPVRADPRGLAEFARIVAKHMTALADELELMAARNGEAVHLRSGLGDQVACRAWAFEGVSTTDESRLVTCPVCRAAAGIETP